MSASFFLKKPVFGSKAWPRALDNTSGLVGYWPFDGDFLDYSGRSGFAAVPTRGTAYLPTGLVSSGAVLLPGSNPYLVLPGNLVTSNVLTVSLWCYFNTLGTYESLFSIYTGNADAFELFFDAGANSFYAGCFNNRLNSQTLPSTRRLYHVAATSNGTNVVIYVNGLRDNPSTGATGFSTFSTAGAIGARGGVAAGDFPVDGFIDDVRVYNRVLSDGEIFSLYNVGIQSYDEGEWSALSVPPSGPTGTLAATEAADVAAFAGTVSNIGTLATTEAKDTAAFAGTYSSAGIWASTEAADVAAFNGNFNISGTLATTEAVDVAAFAGNSGTSGSLSATTGQDIANFTGTGGIVFGSLVATEATDVAALSGNAGVSGSLSATTGQDVAAFTGLVVISATLAATETVDLAVFTALFNVPTGTLAANDNIDTAAFTGTIAIVSAGPLVATDPPDVVVILANFVSVVPPLAPSPYPSPLDYGWFNAEPPVRIRRGGGGSET